MAVSASSATASALQPRLQPGPTTKSSVSGHWLGDDVMQLFDTKLSLLRAEIKEEATEYARDGALIAVGASSLLSALRY